MAEFFKRGDEVQHRISHRHGVVDSAPGEGLIGPVFVHWFEDAEREGWSWHDETYLTHVEHLNENIYPDAPETFVPGDIVELVGYGDFRPHGKVLAQGETPRHMRIRWADDESMSFNVPVDVLKLVEA